MWCKGCQRGQKPNKYGVCPDCRMRLGNGEVEQTVNDLPPVIQKPVTLNDVSPRQPKKEPITVTGIEGGTDPYSDHMTTENMHVGEPQPIEEPIKELEVPKRKKGKRVMSDATKAKIAASMKAKKNKDVSGNV